MSVFSVFDPAWFDHAVYDCYVFSTDAEVSGPGSEVRTAYVAGEVNIAVVQFEDRVYEAPAKPTPPGAPNRRRVL